MGRIKFLKKELTYTVILIFFGVLYMSYQEPKETIFLIISFYSFVKIIDLYKKQDINISKTLALRAITVMLAYVLSVIFLFFQSYEMNLNISKNPITKQAKAVVLVYEGESEKYDMKKQLTNIKLNENILGKIKAPIALSNNKKNYRHIGKSSYKKNTLLFRKKLDQTLSDDDYDVYLGYLNDHEYIEHTLENIVNTGYNKVIIVPMFEGEDESYNAMKNRVSNMNLFDLNIKIRYTEPLSNSEKLVNCYMNKINKHINKEKLSYTGVVLIGSGKDSLEENLMFRNKIKVFLQKFSKLEEQKIKKAWFKDGTNNYIDAVKNILEYGVAEIIVIYTKPGVTNIENKSIMNNIKSEVNLPQEIKIKIIDGFVKEDELVEEVKDRIELLELQKWY